MLSYWATETTYVEQGLYKVDMEHALCILQGSLKL